MLIPGMSGVEPVDDSAQMETDTMRFLAVLSLCLMAIFALVHAVPNQVAQDQAETQSQKKTEQLAIKQQQIMEQQRHLKDWEEQLTVREKKLAQQAKQLLQQKTQLEAAAVLAKATQQTPPSQSDSESSSKTGFVLRFASQQALQALVVSKQVRLFASNGKAYWQLDPVGRLVKVDAPGLIYSMAIATVPKAYVSTAQTVIGVQEQLSFHVHLGQSAQKEINRLLADQAGGDIVIQADGRVVFKP